MSCFLRSPLEGKLDSEYLEEYAYPTGAPGSKMDWPSDSDAPSNRSVVSRLEASRRVSACAPGIITRVVVLLNTLMEYKGEAIMNKGIHTGTRWQMSMRRQSKE